jgi:hypothetical protein
MALTFSRLVAKGRAEANWANCNSIFFIKAQLVFYGRRKAVHFSIYVF